MNLGLQYLLANELVNKSGRRKGVTSGTNKKDEPEKASFFAENPVFLKFIKKFRVAKRV